MSSILQAQQLYTAGIPWLEAYLLPMAHKRTRNEHLSQNKTAASHVGQIHICMHVFREVKNGRLIMYVAVCRTNLQLVQKLLLHNISQYSSHSVAIAPYPW